MTVLSINDSYHNVHQQIKKEIWVKEIERVTYGRTITRTDPISGLF